MKYSQPFKFLLSLVLIHAIILNPLFVPRAMAGFESAASEMHQVCDPIDQASPQEKLRNPALGGMNIAADCDKAKLAAKAHEIEKIKFIMYSVIAVICGALIAFEWAGTGAICKGLSLAGMIAGFIYDQVYSKEASAVAGDWTKTASMIVNGFGALKLAKSIVSNSGFLTKIFGGTVKAATKESANADCILSTAFAAADAGLSYLGMDAATAAVESATASAKSAREAAIANNIHSPTFSDAPQVVAPVAANGVAPKVSTGGSCAGVSGNAFLTCANQDVQDPELSAITSNQGLMNIMDKALGQPVGDFVKNYKGDGSSGSVASYVANGLGIPEVASSVKDMLDKSRELVKKAGDALPAGAYKSHSKPAKKGDAAPDFNALMGNLLKQAGPSDKKAKEDPKAIMFRRLDAMSSDKVLESKDISLFDRITNRYQRKQTEPEPASNP